MTVVWFERSGRCCSSAVPWYMVEWMWHMCAVARPCAYCWCFAAVLGRYMYILVVHVVPPVLGALCIHWCHYCVVIFVHQLRVLCVLTSILCLPCSVTILYLFFLCCIAFPLSRMPGWSCKIDLPLSCCFSFIFYPWHL